MAWLELSLIVTAAQQAEVEAALEDLGALAVTLLDAEDHPIFEPAPGETPLWPEIALSALFEPDRDRAGLVHVLTDLVPDLSPEQIVFRVVEDQDWTRAWMRSEEHTSELQSRENLVCRLLLEKKKKTITHQHNKTKNKKNRQT